jgi:tryptophan synthase alpha subunit
VDVIDRIREFSQTPVCAGFGLFFGAYKSQALSNTALDGIVVASALIDASKTLPARLRSAWPLPPNWPANSKLPPRL